MESRGIELSRDECVEGSVDISHEQLDPLLYQISDISNQPANNQERANLPNSLEMPSPTHTSQKKPTVNAPTAPPRKRRKITSHKKINADMDSDDDLLWHLKLAKWTEKDIHQRFTSEGRTGYREKTIGTRFCRMKKIMRQHTDKGLESGMGGWHEGDDDILSLAVNKAQGEIAKMLAEIEQKKWKLVAEYMKDTKPVVDYSDKACRDRWEALQNGTASIPLEMRSDLSREIVEVIRKRKESEEKIRRYEGERPS